MDTVQQQLDQGVEVTTWPWEVTQLVETNEWESTMVKQQKQQKDGKVGLHFGY
jgi:hypothetical protein